MNSDELPENFNRRLADFTPPYDPAAWKAFERHRRNRNGRRRWFVGWYRTAALIGLLLLGGLAYFRVNPPEPSRGKVRVVQSPGTPVTPDKTPETVAGPSPDQALPAAPNHRPPLDNPRLFSPGPDGSRSESFSPSVEIPDGGAVAQTFRRTSGRYSRNRKSRESDLFEKRLVFEPEPAEEILFSRAESQTPNGSVKIRRLDFLPVKAFQTAFGPLSVQTFGTKPAKAEIRPEKRWDFRLGGGVFSQANYARSGSAAATPGALISAEIGLGRRLDLSSGLGLARQTLRIDGEVVPESAPSGMRRLTGVSYRWLGVQVPLSLRYRFLPGKRQQFFASAGVSALLAFDRQFERHFRTDRIIVTTIELMNGQKQEVSRLETEYEDVRGRIGSESDFQPVGFLNASVGFERLLGGRQRLIVEPYFRYPVGSVGPEHLRFSTLGLQLRWSIRLETGR
ncbi:hypothetical protein [Larkinella soli]|uniref:hypothetical protein n=1 Tax=Larkinella soli TaxID=1770527 RepID=UPI000FFC7997|nr:hypothetical protein [Larkinella soli]